LASFHTGKKKIIYFSGAFHGRTAAAVACTDNPKIVAPVNQSENFVKLPFNDLEALENEFKTNPDIAGVIVEGIQGVGGVQIPTTQNFYRKFNNCVMRTMRSFHRRRNSIWFRKKR
jgi:acetylornithine aminotransferase